jgi:hypothetical protein
LFAEEFSIRLESWIFFDFARFGLFDPVCSCCSFTISCRIPIFLKHDPNIISSPESTDPSWRQEENEYHTCFRIFIFLYSGPEEMIFESETYSFLFSFRFSSALLAAEFSFFSEAILLSFNGAAIVSVAIIMMAMRQLPMRARGWKREALQESINVAIRSIYEENEQSSTLQLLLNEFPQSGYYRGMWKEFVISDKKTSEKVSGDGSKQLMFKKMNFELSEDNLCHISGTGISEGLVNAAGLAYWVEETPSDIQKLVTGQFHGNDFSGEYLTANGFRGTYEMSEHGDEEELEISIGIPVDHEASIMTENTRFIIVNK